MEEGERETRQGATQEREEVHEAGRDAVRGQVVGGVRNWWQQPVSAGGWDGAAEQVQAGSPTRQSHHSLAPLTPAAPDALTGR